MWFYRACNGTYNRIIWLWVQYSTTYCFMGMGSQAFKCAPKISRQTHIISHPAALYTDAAYEIIWHTCRVFHYMCQNLCLAGTNKGLRDRVRELGMRDSCQRCASLGTDSLVPAEQNLWQHVARLWPKCTGTKSDVPQMLGSVSGGKKIITITCCILPWHLQRRHMFFERSIIDLSTGNQWTTIWDGVALQKPLPNSRDKTNLGVGCVSSSVHVDQIPNGIDRR